MLEWGSASNYPCTLNETPVVTESNCSRPTPHERDKRLAHQAACARRSTNIHVAAGGPRVSQECRNFTRQSIGDTPPKTTSKIRWQCVFSCFFVVQTSSHCVEQECVIRIRAHSSSTFLWDSLLWHTCDAAPAFYPESTGSQVTHMGHTLCRPQAAKEHVAGHVILWHKSRWVSEVW